MVEERDQQAAIHYVQQQMLERPEHSLQSLDTPLFEDLVYVTLEYGGLANGNILELYTWKPQF